MTTEIPMRRSGNHLVPVNQMGADDLATVPTDRDLLVVIRTPRNVAQFSLAWALASKVSDACEWLMTKETAMDWMLMQARHVRYIHDPRTGRATILPKSISWASLGQDAFNRLFNRMIYVVITQIVPGLKESDLRREIEAMCVGNTKRRAA